MLKTARRYFSVVVITYPQKTSDINAARLNVYLYELKLMCRTHRADTEPNGAV